jgi:beta-phosphoglucomutase
VRRKQELTVALLADSPRIYAGVAELVGLLRGRALLGVVSGTWRDNITTVLAASGLLEAFDAIVGKDDVRAVKPDPECYRLALAKLGVHAAEAIALEDSSSGLRAARGAGLRTIAVGHRLPAGEWVGTSPFLDDLSRPHHVVELLELKL